MNNIAICFCVRNCANYLNDIFSNIELLKKLNINLYSVFVYDNCIDNTEDLLKKYQDKYSDNVIVRNIENKSKLRTIRIAKARNICLNIVYNELDNITYHIMIDCDDSCSPKWNIDVINRYLNNYDNDNWDCISFNKKHYYDIWALMFDNFKHHCWGFNTYSNNIKVVSIMKENIINKLKNSKTNSIEVISAFNGFSIYKTNRFKDFYYDGLYSNVKELITNEERNSTLIMLKEKYNLNIELSKNCEMCCEHIFYHLSAFKKGRKIKISKFEVIPEVIPEVSVLNAQKWKNMLWT